MHFSTRAAPPPPPQCTVVTVGSTGGTASGGDTVDCGESVTIKATANSGYCFVRWTIAGPPDDFAAATDEAASSCEKTSSHSVDTHRNTPQVTYQAIFEPQQCTLSVTDDEGGTASQSAASVACGGSITATATANACYDFTGWTGDVTTTSRSVGITMDRSKSIHANFAHDGTKHTLTVRVHGGGTATGAGTHDCGTIVVAKATANLGWRFKTWEPDRFGTKTTTRVLMMRSGWIAAHFERDIVAWGSFTVTGTGSAQSAAAGDAAGRAATEAARLGADRHWRTAISYQTTTSSMVTYRSTVTASWSRTGTTTGEAYGILPNSKGEASSVGLQVAVAAAKSRAYRGIPSDATFRGYLSTVSSGYNADAKLGPVGHWALAWARWVRRGTVTGSGSGETKAAAESAALGDARSKAAGSLSGISHSTSKTTETVVTVTATADYTWVQYRGQEAAAQSGVGTGTDGESAIPAHEPEPE